MSPIYFWQNTLSIHQSDLLEALASKSDVCLIVRDSKISARVDEGWLPPQLNSVTVISFDRIDEESLDWSGIHVVSGLGVYRDFDNVMKKVSAAKGKLYLLTEKPNLNGLKGFLRNIKYSFWLKYRSSIIDGIFCIGENTKKWVEALSSGAYPVYEFLYAGPTGIEKKNSDTVALRKFVYIGRVESQKGIDIYLQAASNYPRYEFSVIGRCMEPKLAEKMGQLANINYLGVVDNQELKRRFKDYDCLILPSRHDGWGYVVNECLAAGIPCLVSDACGAKSVIRSGLNGEVFSSGSYEDLASSMEKMLNMEFHPSQIISFFERAISADAIAEYFLECIVSDAAIPPTVPWRR
ncbi:glycosyltransferase [Isoalcanivorax pacificus]|uniref:glycosyltransferase n=1 Tax=Isoalcanivorax pacificus TaxID=1306787 RepID=UPI0009E2E715|nr:glycosyltransferase [Isoalcanivorax pacificus]